ncbi:NADPH--cytochrome P450 reductase [Spathaspora passalidarum NRRL Y-27907]|uniref:NADPH--cytochrome P450 reductase n=1 Tax=Spathaspora passalidarum (strain NRRL Y-27907 / 11-Y1) TaxID=619300 RepID=G3AH31_SPAPN|nr:NADPH--cytochrome P450 reductase [Spathaspora passalidarum NRRL Y-27907]EGW35461.1 NADPH--cytochrome P450 reductase [Spathaspora passalidarum NRRL Y-27907]
MAVDSLDLIVVSLLAAAIAGYYLKNHFLAPPESKGFITTPASGGATNTRDILQTLHHHDKNVLLLYGSQTGTAEDFSHKMARELTSRFDLKCMVADFADYDWDNLKDISSDVLVFFVMATYGEGEPTDNAIEFFDYLETEDDLSSLRYCVFGLGNSTYEFFNAIGRKTRDLLTEKQAESFAPYGEGDDGLGTLDEDFLAWKDGVFESLRNNLHFEEQELKFQPRIKLEVRDDLTAEDETVALGEPNKRYLNSDEDLTKGPFDNTHPYVAPIVNVKELFKSEERHCVHVDFDISGSNLKYTTGDHLAIWPSNSNENIEKFVEAFGLKDKLDEVFDLKRLDQTYVAPFPTPITFGAVLRHHLEISGPISRQLLLSIAEFALTDEVKKSIMALANNKAKFAEEITAKKYNFADVLLKISNGQPWTKVPFEFIIENLQHLTPRYYSISSSSSKEKNTISVTAVVEAEQIEDRLITGVVTNLLKDIDIVKNKRDVKPLVTYNLSGPRNKFFEFKLPVHVRRSTFKLPTSSTTPIIMIGPGTGVAPLRGFIRERVQQFENGVNVGKSVLFYGCRNREQDYLYKDEWVQYGEVLGDKFELFTAFSREDPNKKVYVQHKLLENSAKINQMLLDGAMIYVCGDAAHMARDVQAAFAKIISDERDISVEKAGVLIRSLKVQNRYQEDVW